MLPCLAMRSGSSARHMTGTRANTTTYKKIFREIIIEFSQADGGVHPESFEGTPSFPSNARPEGYHRDGSANSLLHCGISAVSAKVFASARDQNMTRQFALSRS